MMVIWEGNLYTTLKKKKKKSETLTSMLSEAMMTWQGQRWWEKRPSSGLGAPDVLRELDRPRPFLDLGVSDCKVMEPGSFQGTPQPQFSEPLTFDKGLTFLQSRMVVTPGRSGGPRQCLRGLRSSSPNSEPPALPLLIPQAAPDPVPISSLPPESSSKPINPLVPPPLLPEAPD